MALKCLFAENAEDPFKNLGVFELDRKNEIQSTKVAKTFFRIFLRQKSKKFNQIFFLQNIAVSAGSSQADIEKLKEIIEAVPQLRYICLDVANGYAESFVETVRTVRSEIFFQKFFFQKFFFQKFLEN